jgi:RimJ/RimL family protein N-acetyltransferase
MIGLIETDDDDFAWMLDGATKRTELRLPPGGVDDRPVLELLRRVSTDLRRSHFHGSWMIAVDGEVVGLCGCKSPPNSEGVVEIGYGVAAARRGLGYATRAVAALLEAVAQDTSVRCVVAETSVANVASQRVLESNGFVRAGERTDAMDGEFILWRHDLPPPDVG